MDAGKKMLTGNDAAAHGARLANVRVVPVYPITPQTTIIEKIIEFITEKEMDAEYIPIESEHSAMAAAIGAEATGIRTFTASSSQGIAYMHENLFVASGLRLPLVMVAVNRTMNPPIAGAPDHSDTLAQRDTGWLQIYVENAQEILDMVIQAYRIAEDKDVLLPVMICYEGMVISHFLEPVDIPAQKLIDGFLPCYNPDHVVLDTKRPMHVSVISDEFLTEYRYQQEEAMENSKRVIEEVDKEFKKVFGREYGGLLSGYMTEDAEVVLVGMGNTCNVARMTIYELRKQGIKAGFMKLRAFRPFPKEALEESLRSAELVIMLDRAVSSGYGGVVYPELAASLSNLTTKPYVLDYIIGLANKKITVPQLSSLVTSSLADYKNGTIINPIQWIGVEGL
ncbi:transketolase C-terminal domain-containing protein [Chloroflexota bacterium]